MPIRPFIMELKRETGMQFYSYMIKGRKQKLYTDISLPGISACL